MIISGIVAVSDNGCIGAGGKLVWHLPADLKFFKQITLNHTIVMGRSTFESIGRPLPKRRNLVLTRNPNWHHAGVEAFLSVEQVLTNVRENAEKEIFIIGGAEIYQLFMPQISQFYITQVHSLVQGDAFFELPEAEFTCTNRTSVPKDAQNVFDMTFTTWLRTKI